MNGSWQNKRWLLVAILVAGLLRPNLLVTQAITSAVASTSVSAKDTPAGQFLKSPVDSFRELLAMTSEEREKNLSVRPAKVRDGLQAKIQEYEALDADERELRLQVTELHWYLLPLMKIPAGKRAERLAQIPPDMRKLVEERLQIWTILPPPLTDALADNQPILRLLLARPETNTAAILTNMPPDQQSKLEAGIAQWQAMPESQRLLICRQFNSFFDLTAEEKQRALNTLSDAERQQMDKTLREFENLPKDQRATCIQSFRKFSDMSLPERELFLRNAELWKTMSPDERRVWRDLVSQVPNWPPMPPLPPEFPPFPPTMTN
jgi:Protein of unknown function (DUF3106)